MLGSFLEESILRVKTQLGLPLLGVRPVTFETMVRKNRADVPIEVNSRWFSRRSPLDKATETERRRQRERTSKEIGNRPMNIETNHVEPQRSGYRPGSC